MPTSGGIGDSAAGSAQYRRSHLTGKTTERLATTFADIWETVRHGETLTCPCGFEGHADLTATATFLRENSDTEVRPMARPVRFEWDDHA